MKQNELLDGLFTINSLTEQEDIYKFAISLNPSHAVFKGHFPGLPVLPGVCMLYLIKSCIAQILQTPIQFDYIRSCKFIAAVNPEKTDKLNCHIQVSAENKIEATLTQQEQTILKLKATVKPR